MLLHGCERSQIVRDGAALASYELRETVCNPCDGRGEIRHYVCECGNVLAGMIDASALDGDELTALKNRIREYSRRGVHFDPVLYDRAQAATEAKRKLGTVD